MSVAELQAALDSAGAQTALTRSTLVSVATGAAKPSTVRIAMTPPADLAAQAGLPRSTYALARCIRSEGYGGDPIGRAAAAVAIGQAIRNGATIKGRGIEATLTASTFGAAAGFYGEQTGRYAATTLEPTRWTADVAQQVLDDTVPDLARGAHKFLDLAVFAGGTQAGRELSPIANVLKSWMLGPDELEWKGPIPTVDTYHLVLLGRGHATLAERQAQRDQLLDIYERGQAGDHGPEEGDPDDVGGGVPALLVVLGCIGLGYLLVQTGVV